MKDERMQSFSASSRYCVKSLLSVLSHRPPAKRSRPTGNPRMSANGREYQRIWEANRAIGPGAPLREFADREAGGRSPVRLKGSWTFVPLLGRHSSSLRAERASVILYSVTEFALLAQALLDRGKCFPRLVRPQASGEAVVEVLPQLTVLAQVIPAV